MQRIESVDSALLREWRQNVPWSATTCGLRLQQVKTFLRFAENAGWIAKSPASSIRPPKRCARPTMPLEGEGCRAMLEAARDKPKERALAISDSVSLARSSVNGSLLMLRGAKSGELAFGSLPAPVIEALDGIARPDRARYFWTGNSALTTATTYWRERLRLVASQAGVADVREQLIG